MKLNMKSLDNITWDRLSRKCGDLSVAFADDPGQPIVFGDGFPRADGRAKFTPAIVIAPDEVPDAEYPMILTTGRQLEHWHTGSMTRRSKCLDAVEPEANCSLHPKTLRSWGLSRAACCVYPPGADQSRSWRGRIGLFPRIWCSCPSPMSKPPPIS